jgi:concanavalin A-like lectin/glucanase superfamily protein
MLPSPLLTSAPRGPRHGSPGRTRPPGDAGRGRRWRAGALAGWCAALGGALWAVGCSALSDADRLKGGDPTAGMAGASGAGAAGAGGGQAGRGGAPAMTAGAAGAGGGAAGASTTGGAAGAAGGAGGGGDEAAQAYFDEIAKDSPAAFYRFETLTADKATHSEVASVDLTCADERHCAGDACCPTLVDGGLFGRAARFDGAGNRLIAAAADAFAFFNTGAFTFELWLKVDFAGALPDKRLRLVTKDQGSPPTQRGSVFGLEPANGTEPANVSFTRYDQTQSYLLKWREAEKLGGGDFVHLVLTHEAAAPDAKLYVDGVPVTVSNTGASPASPDPATPLTVGNSLSGGNGIKGVLDDLAIYPSALPAERVAAHHAVVRARRGAGGL